jgi:hypothetical protein
MGECQLRSQSFESSLAPVVDACRVRLGASSDLSKKIGQRGGRQKQPPPELASNGMVLSLDAK